MFWIPIFKKNLLYGCEPNASQSFCFDGIFDTNSKGPSNDASQVIYHQNGALSVETNQNTRLPK